MTYSGGGIIGGRKQPVIFLIQPGRAWLVCLVQHKRIRPVQY